jgi:hypothetical protein
VPGRPLADCFLITGQQETWFPREKELRRGSREPRRETIPRRNARYFFFFFLVAFLTAFLTAFLIFFLAAMR